ncbi:MAG: hybrid sensor histidine kinase/response regulator [Bacteroidales bacterium]|nr:hybrid sensor histidine kinase/response regulator [Bacteroidales bacterium]
MASNNEEAKILLVDDSVQNLRLLGNMLREKSYQIALAQNGKEGLQLAAKILPDLILLDIMMPELDGYEVCKQLKEDENTRHIPVIFLTAKTSNNDIVNGFQIGGVDYITKPFNKEELFMRIKTHLELKQAHDKISRQAESLRELNATKDKMFSVISHDLRAPLGGIKSMLDLMYEDQSAEKKISPQSLNSLKNAADQTYNLLENLLYWSRSQRGKLVNNPEMINIYELVVENMELLQTMSENKKLEVKNQVDTQAEAWADRNMVKTVLRNLIINAIKFTREKGQITITSEYKDGLLEVSVGDNGVGIQKQNLEKILNMKEYYTTFGTKREKGSGLGLNLCIDFIRRNNGELYIDSDYGKGSTFTFTLPVKESAIQENAE